MNIVENGFETIPNFLDSLSVKEIIGELESLESSYPSHGIRNAEKKLPSIRTLVHSNLLLDKAQGFLSSEPQIVRVIIFDKTPDKNWLVTWHQDKTVCVSTKVDISGWGPWTLKDGMHHVQPDIHVLENMVTFRIHLDDTDESNGCLKVIPDSHQFGILTKDKLDSVVNTHWPYVCNAKSGDLLVMRPLLLHASSKGNSPSHRRIVHVEYSSFKLPNGITWA